MSQIKSVTILGKSTTGNQCPFDTDEVWGVNNVADHPEFSGQIKELVIENAGTGYQNAPTIEFKGGGGVPPTATAEVKNGSLVSVKIEGRGTGYTSAPEVIIKGDGSGAVIRAKIHPKRTIHKLFAFDILPKEYTDGMKQNAPICSWQDYKDIDYPIDDVIKSFDSRYFTNTVSYMVAYAAYLNVPLIKIYGVDVTFGAPYAQENRGVEYWIGRAQERGCTVEVAPNSHLLRTVSGVMYGVKDACNVNLYLNERIALINMLPHAGRYSDALKAQNAHWVLIPKTDEAKAHGIQVQQGPNGATNYQCGSEFLSDVHMPPETWEYLRGILRDLEAKGELPFSVISAYEKLILSKPDGGN